MTKDWLALTRHPGTPASAEPGYVSSRTLSNQKSAKRECILRVLASLGLACALFTWHSPKVRPLDVLGTSDPTKRDLRSQL